MESGSKDIRKSHTLDQDAKDDPATREWCKLIDLDTVIEPKLDWHSTRTFELFLDALDVNQFVIKGDKKDKLKTEPTSSDGAQDKIVTDNAAKLNGEQKMPNSGAIKSVDTYQGIETILSAEALKILSELPDLSHMSSSRSFIFPTYNKAKK